MTAMEETKIMLVMLSRGEIIIAHDMTRAQEHPTRGWYLLEYPALLIHERPHPGTLGFMLTPWIPTELIDGRLTPSIELSGEQVVGFMIPSPELARYYKTWADIEQDKWKHFGKEFNQQVVEIEKITLDRYQEAKRRRTVAASSPEAENNDLLIALFEEDTNWGNPKVTH